MERQTQKDQGVSQAHAKRFRAECSKLLRVEAPFLMTTAARALLSTGFDGRIGIKRTSGWPAFAMVTSSPSIASSIRRGNWVFAL